MSAPLNKTKIDVMEKVSGTITKNPINVCPDCHLPEFKCLETKSGLPCNNCGQAIPLVKVYHCSNCSYTDERSYSHGKYCDNCK